MINIMESEISKIIFPTKSRYDLTDKRHTKQEILDYDMASDSYYDKVIRTVRNKLSYVKAVCKSL